jgi:hypothetical protein
MNAPTAVFAAAALLALAEPSSTREPLHVDGVPARSASSADLVSTNGIRPGSPTGVSHLAASPPVVVATRVENTDEGLTKTAVIEIRNGTCLTGTITALLGRFGTSGWGRGAFREQSYRTPLGSIVNVTPLPAPRLVSGSTASGEVATWAIRIPRSDRFPAGSRYAILWSVPYSGSECSPPRIVFATSVFVVTAAFQLTVVTDPVEVPRAGSAPVTVQVRRQPTCLQPIVVALTNLPPGVTATPASVTVGAEQASATVEFQLTGSPSAVPATSTAAAVGTAPPYSAQRARFVVCVARPQLTSVSPPVQVRGGPVTVTGQNFDENCSHNTVAFAGIQLTPAPCTATSLAFHVPSGAAYGPTRIQVTTNLLTSNELDFRVVSQLFDLTVSPDRVELAKGASANLSMYVNRAQGFTDTVNVALSGVPAGVTASPASMAVSGSLAIVTLNAAANALPATGVVTATGTSGTYQSQASFVVTVARPSVTGVSPAVQARGGMVAVSGTNFDPNRTHNYVTLAGINVVPSPSCTTTMLNVTVPGSAGYGPTQLKVTANAVESNTITFTVGRQAGPFVDITADIENNLPASEVCTGGAVRLAATGSNPYYTATYRRTSDNGVIGMPIDFSTESGLMEAYSGATPYQLGGGGGAGFSLCSAGIVLNLRAPASYERYLAFEFLNLDSGRRYHYAFDHFTAVDDSAGYHVYAGIDPEIFRSPDGTVFVLKVASDAGDNERGVVIDRERGTVIGTIEFPRFGSVSSALSAVITPDNQVIVTYGGAAYPGIRIQ